MLFDPLPTLYSRDVSALSPLPGLTLNLVTISDPHGLGSGNKQFKLHSNLQFAEQRGYRTIVSFGGAYSNHISALAEACKSHDLACVGIIRGEANYANNETLANAQQQGMRLKFVDRKTYRQRGDAVYLQALTQAYPNALILPEGGSNVLAVQGCEGLAEKVNELLPQTTVICSACGTGGTVAGLIRGAKRGQRVLGFSVVNDAGLGQRVTQFVAEKRQADYELLAADFGGYAKVNLEHLQFIEQWYTETGVLLDPVYSSKMCRALMQSIQHQAVAEQAVISIIHTGGLQGWWGMKKRVQQLGKAYFWDEVVEPYLQQAVS